MKTKIVHIWNICGIGGLLSRYMDRYFDYESIALMRKAHDPYGHANEKTITWDTNSKIWLLRCIWRSRKADIIHIHSGVQWLPWFKRFYPDKKYVIHFHGTKIRARWEEYDLSGFDAVIVSTPDLLEGSPPGTHYLPNPVDEELIQKVKEYLECEPIHAAFHVDRYAVDKAHEYAAKYGLELVIFKRDEIPMKKEHFLRYMGKYEYFICVERSEYLLKVGSHEYYVDVKRDYPGHKHADKVLEAFSLTGLEALALGCKVIDWNGDLIDMPLVEFGSEVIAKRLDTIYKDLMK